MVHIFTVLLVYILIENESLEKPALELKWVAS
uniref:Uncharacterized protein n=1 Tax=Rhizophora mucronata TaxID=61149 RepID=A0A2P2P0I0_RHIMU